MRENGDWERWLDFFWDAIIDTAKESHLVILKLHEQIQSDRKKISSLGRGGVSALEVHQAMLRHPIADIAKLKEMTGLVDATIGSALRRLLELGIIEETADNRRNRFSGSGPYLDKL